MIENPNIVKVLHGCLFSDVSWLQRDFGLQMVNAIDTQELHKEFMTHKTTEKAKKHQNQSLAMMWKIYCNELKYTLSKEDKEKF